MKLVKTQKVQKAKKVDPIKAKADALGQKYADAKSEERAAAAIAQEANLLIKGFAEKKGVAKENTVTVKGEIWRVGYCVVDNYDIDTKALKNIVPKEFLGKVFYEDVNRDQLKSLVERGIIDKKKFRKTIKMKPPTLRVLVEPANKAEEKEQKQ